MNYPKHLYLTNTQYREALHRLKRIIEEEKLAYFDDTTPGDKDTQCSWGLCSDSMKLWPEKSLHLFDRLPSPKYTRPMHLCPFDDRDSVVEPASGCFYHCMIFKHGLKPSKKEALELLDKRIKLCPS